MTETDNLQIGLIPKVWGILPATEPSYKRILIQRSTSFFCKGLVRTYFRLPAPQFSVPHSFFCFYKKFFKKVSCSWAETGPRAQFGDSCSNPFVSYYLRISKLFLWFINSLLLVNFCWLI